MKDGRKERTACQEATEAYLEKIEPHPGEKEAVVDWQEVPNEEKTELNQEMMQSEVEHREVPTDKTTVKSSGTMKKRHEGRHLTAGHCGKPKELTQGDCGSHRRLAAACRKVSCHSRVA
jgi:hypothetical protein